jgi:dihydroorotate dehydrogenase (NAD+) catalytic subunit
VPIIGLGGVLTWQDAAEFILVGATAVGVGTALFVDPRKPVELADGLARWVREQGAANVADLVGAMEG